MLLLENKKKELFIAFKALSFELLSIIFLFLTCLSTKIDFLFVLFLVLNITSFIVSQIIFIKYKDCNLCRHVFFLIYKIVIFLSGFLFLFYSSCFGDLLPFLAPKNISIIFYFLELILSIILTSKLGFLFAGDCKELNAGKKRFCIFKPKKINIRFNLKSFLFIVFCSLSAVSFSLGGVFSQNGKFESFSQSLTFIEKKSNGRVILSFSSLDEKKNGNLFNYSKLYSDGCYFGKKEYCPIVLNNSNYLFQTINSDGYAAFSSVKFISFYNFDCYKNKDKWISTYSGLNFIGPSKNSGGQSGIYDSFVSYSLAKKIMISEGLSDINEVVGKTIFVKDEGNFIPLFVSNIVLANTFDYERYIDNYGDFAVLRKTATILTHNKCSLDFYFTNSSSYNKDLIRNIFNIINDSNCWDISVKSPYKHSINPNDYWSLFSKTDIYLAILFFIFGFCVFIIPLYILKQSSFINDVFLASIIFLIILFFFIQTAFYILWYYFSFFVFPSSSILLLSNVFLCTLHYALIIRKEDKKCLLCSKQENLIILSI